MPGLYPDDQTINIFGSEVRWPGLDPNTSKFTNGDFNNPLVKPSFFPAETINLILDNLQTFISGLGLEPNNTDPDQLLKALRNSYSSNEWLMDFLFPIGSRYNQGINDPTPKERNFPGSWTIWSGRVEQYELISGSLPSYTPYTPGANYAIGAYVLDHLPGDDWRIFRAKAAITNAPQYLNPINWDPLQPGIIVDRRHLQDWGDDDFTVGKVLTDGSYAGWSVSGIIVRGGKFESIEGGHRPTYGSGTAPDVSRLIKGQIPVLARGGNSDGPLSLTPAILTNTFGVAAGMYVRELIFDSGQAIPTAPEGSPRTISIRYWRRVA